MEAIGYVRISTRDQSNYSLDFKENRIKEYCTRNKVKLISIYKDDGESSHSFDRPDYLALENLSIKKGRSFWSSLVKILAESRVVEPEGVFLNSKQLDI